MGSYNSRFIQKLSIVASDDWNKKPKAIRDLEKQLNMSIFLLTESEKHQWNAESLFNILKTENLISMGTGDYTLFIEETETFIYLNLINSSKENIESFKVNRIYGNNHKEIISNDFKFKYGHQIKLIVMYRLIWDKLYFLDCPFIPNNIYLPDTITSKGINFKQMNNLFNDDYFNNTKCLVLNKFNMKNGLIYIINWERNMTKNFISLTNESICIINPLTLSKSNKHLIAESTTIYQIADIIHKLETYF